MLRHPALASTDLVPVPGRLGRVSGTCSLAAVLVGA